MSTSQETNSNFLTRAFARLATPAGLALPAQGLATIYPGVFYGFEETDSDLAPEKWIDLGIGHKRTPPSVVYDSLGSSPGTDPAADLTSAIGRKYRDEQQHELDPETNVLLTAGARVGFAVGMLALVNPGDTVVIPDPDYIGLLHMAAAIGARIRRMPLDRRPDGQFAVDPERLADALKDARMFAFTNPNNPMGMVWSKEALEVLAKEAGRNGTYLLTSEIYDELIFEAEPFVSLATLADPERTLITNGTAKAYDMAGFSIGWMICGSALHAELHNLMLLTHQAQPSEPSMLAASTVLDAKIRQFYPAELVTEMRATAKRLQAVLCKHTIEPVTLPQGGQFLFPRFEGDDFKLAQHLKRTAGLLTVPGQIWGAQGRGHLRIALMPSPETFDQALVRLDQALATADR